MKKKKIRKHRKAEEEEEETLYSLVFFRIGQFNYRILKSGVPDEMTYGSAYSGLMLHIPHIWVTLDKKTRTTLFNTFLFVKNSINVSFRQEETKPFLYSIVHVDQRGQSYLLVTIAEPFNPHQTWQTINFQIKAKAEEA